ncbi:glycosyltransferase [Vagococcus sp. DIV0080]|uniref:Glycosyltransferase n=1 Tax=Candidatus Vagococcus giribetii TaxID=2230876 RepID=A0ABS3HU77_9ENTE|nr:glycosyltransferase [Vagococcus sp. DIV0080]MBO0477310.1 glycosyltransferase [Vagococcus sp. DIV0080]
MTKVLHVLGYMPVGGVGSLLLGLKKNINDDIEMDCLLFKSSKKSNFSEEWTRLGGKLKIIPFELKVRNYFKIRKYINDFFKDSNYDIVHLHSPNLGFIIFPISKKHNVRIRILHSHSTIHSEKKIRNYRNSILVRLGNRKASYRVACSQDAGDFLFSGKEFLFLPNGIDVKKFLYSNYTRKVMRENISEDTKIIGMIGNLTPIKNQQFILKLAPQLLKKNSNISFWFIGEGIDRNKLEEFVEQQQLSENVKFLGRRDDISNLLQAIDIFVMPSEYEGFGISAIEAQAAGLPCIVSKGVPNEIKISDYVKFISLKDTEKWINQLEFFLSLNICREEINYQIEQSIYNIENSTQILKNYYLKLMEEN